MYFELIFALMSKHIIYVITQRTLDFACSEKDTIEFVVKMISGVPLRRCFCLFESSAPKKLHALYSL